MSKIVRIKPYNRKLGHLLRRYTIEGRRFEESRGWYRVSDDLAAKLSKVQQPPAPKSEVVGNEPLAFDVCDDESEAAQVEKALAVKKERRTAAEPHDLTTRDLRQGTEASSEPEPEPDPKPARAGRRERATRPAEE